MVLRASSIAPRSEKVLTWSSSRGIDMRRSRKKKYGSQEWDWRSSSKSLLLVGGPPLTTFGSHRLLQRRWSGRRRRRRCFGWSPRAFSFFAAFWKENWLMVLMVLWECVCLPIFLRKKLDIFPPFGKNSWESKLNRDPSPRGAGANQRRREESPSLFLPRWCQESFPSSSLLKNSPLRPPTLCPPTLVQISTIILSMLEYNFNIFLKLILPDFTVIFIIKLANFYSSSRVLSLSLPRRPELMQSTHQLSFSLLLRKP